MRVWANAYGKGKNRSAFSAARLKNPELLDHVSFGAAAATTIIVALAVNLEPVPAPPTGFVPLRVSASPADRFWKPWAVAVCRTPRALENYNDAYTWQSLDRKLDAQPLQDILNSGACRLPPRDWIIERAKPAGHGVDSLRFPECDAMWQGTPPPQAAYEWPCGTWYATRRTCADSTARNRDAAGRRGQNLRRGVDRALVRGGIGIALDPNARSSTPRPATGG